MGASNTGRSSRPPPAPATASSEPASSRAPESVAPASSAPLSDCRSLERHSVAWSVDCEADDTFLYAAIANISELGIFVRTESPLAVGTAVSLRFAATKPREFATDGPSPAFGVVFDGGPFALRGTVQWVNAPEVPGSSPNPGMGIKFVGLTPDDRERLVELVKTIAYLRTPVGEAAD